MNPWNGGNASILPGSGEAMGGRHSFPAQAEQYFSVFVLVADLRKSWRHFAVGQRKGTALGVAGGTLPPKTRWFEPLEQGRHRCDQGIRCNRAGLPRRSVARPVTGRAGRDALRDTVCEERRCSRRLSSSRRREILISATVKDLVAGSGLGFVDRGSHTLKGVAGRWRLFAVQT